ncbi:hypothetical protein VKS41_002134 [Umbelopsis sp. WA50703]|jgi:hypothetical protein
MADAGRKDFSQQAKEAIKPDSQKTYTEQAGEKLSGTVDQAKGAVMPEGEKSAHQSAFDSGKGNSQEGIIDKAKDTLGLNKNK